MQSAIISVHIRKKRLNNGNESLYLDIYSDGERSYEFLKLYLVPETNRKSKSENKETMRVAESMRVQRMAELQKSRALRIHGSRTGLVQYIERCISKKSNGTASTYRNVLVAARSFFGDKFILEEITEDDVRKFFLFLESYRNRNSKDRTISPTTQNLYCTTFKSFLNQAAKENLIRNGIADNIEIPRKTESVRSYLTIEELQLLAGTKLNYWYKRCFIFSCLTGLRRSDIKRLTWGDVTEQDGYTRIIFRQKKTGDVQYLDIVPLARRIMGERRGCFDKVFERFQCDNRTNKAIQKWAESVGIHKKLTFHCARHTFAVMMLTLDTDIYTVSKLLGHKELSTTQIYAKIVDKKKQEAVTKIPIVIQVIVKLIETTRHGCLGRVYYHVLMKHYVYEVPDYEHEGDLAYARQELLSNFPKIENVETYEERDYEAESDYEEDYGECDEPIYRGYVEFDAPDEYAEALVRYSC